MSGPNRLQDIICSIKNVVMNGLPTMQYMNIVKGLVKLKKIKKNP